ncbi:endonuclease [Actinoplanes sp. ATCC 53533]|nr:endonuclease [Actinoplanes sp. ATCC 53533]
MPPCYRRTVPIRSVRSGRGRGLVARSVVLIALTIVCTQESGRGRVREPLAAPQSAPPAASPAPSAPAPSAMDGLAGPAAPADLDVMTFNLRYASTITPNSWAQRRPVTRALLTTERPDLIGTQEGLVAQLRDVEADLGAGYDYIGTGRNGGDLDEHMAIFFNKARLLPRQSGNFWLSATPAVPGSISWGSRHVRMVTWVLFDDLATGRRFYAVNTHLDNASENARRHAAGLIRHRLAAFDPLPIVLTGDFNTPAGPGSQVYHLLVDQAGLRDTWTTAARRGPSYATIHNYQPLVPDGERADWILTTPGATALATLVNTHHRGNQFPSDHLPVQVRLRLP